MNPEEWTAFLFWKDSQKLASQGIFCSPWRSIGVPWFILYDQDIQKVVTIFLRKRLNGGTVPPFKMHSGGTVPPFKMHPGGTQSLYDI